MKIKVTGDSSCDLSQELIEKFNFSILPIHICLGDKEYKDAREINQDEFYKFLKTNSTLPKTSAPNVEETLEFFKSELAKDGGYDAIIHFTISSKISSTYQNAVIASQECDNKVFVVDSLSLSTGVGLQMLYCAELVSQGLDASEIFEKMLARREKVQASFVIDKLTYLHKGGRCSAVAKWAAGLLSIKPIICLKDGAMGVDSKIMGKYEKIVPEYVDYILRTHPDIDPKYCFITHAPVEAGLVDVVREKIKDKFENVIETTAGCTISTHCGPNTLGILYYKK